MKKYRVYFDTDAEDDLFEIAMIAREEQTSERAAAIIDSLKTHCRTLTTVPVRGHVPPELMEIGVTEFREIHDGVYRIIYSIEVRTFYVHCIVDGRRDIETTLQQRFFRHTSD